MKLFFQSLQHLNENYLKLEYVKLLLPLPLDDQKCHLNNAGEKVCNNLIVVKFWWRKIGK